MMTTYYPTIQHSRFLKDADRSVWTASDDANYGPFVKGKIILAIEIGYNGKDTAASAYKLQWRDVTDGGSFTGGGTNGGDVAATGEVKWAATSAVLADGTALTEANHRCTSMAATMTWQNGLENVADNLLPDAGTFDLGSDCYTEFQFALDLTDADAGHQYEFRLWNNTSGLTAGTCACKVTTQSVTGLTVANCSHTHTVTAPTLTEKSTLSIQNMSHGHTVDVPSLVQKTPLTVQVASHVHLVDDADGEDAVLRPQHLWPFQWSGDYTDQGSTGGLNLTAQGSGNSFNNGLVLNGSGWAIGANNADVCSLGDTFSILCDFTDDISGATSYGLFSGITRYSEPSIAGLRIDLESTNLFEINSYSPPGTNNIYDKSGLTSSRTQVVIVVSGGNCTIYKDGVEWKASAAFTSPSNNTTIAFAVGAIDDIASYGLRTTGTIHSLGILKGTAWSADDVADIYANTTSAWPTTPGLTLTQTHNLTSQDAGHVNSLGDPILTQLHILAATNVNHVQAITEPILEESTGATELILANMAHAHSLDIPTLTRIIDLILDSLSHVQSLDALILTQLHTLATANLAHAQVATEQVLTQQHQLAAQDMTHGQAAQNIDLSQAQNLVLDNLVHNQSLDTFALTQLHSLLMSNLDHAQVADALLLTITGLTKRRFNRIPGRQFIGGGMLSIPGDSIIDSPDMIQN